MIGDAGENVFEPDERINSDALTGSHETPQHRGGLAAFITAKEDPVVAAHCYATNRAFGGIMPIPGLCRAELLRMLRSGRISDSRDGETRHNPGIGITS
jgi:hypothetical protein